MARRLLGLLLLLILPSVGQSLVLGEEELQSGLSQPLKLAISLVQTGDVALDSIAVSMGSEADYAAYGLEYDPLFQFLEFSFSETVGSSSLYLLVESRFPISSPYLDILVKLEWPGGALEKAYTVLLDPI